MTGSSVTGGGEAAAQLLMSYGYSQSTWSNRVSPLRKWLAFCDEEGRVPLPANEGDVLAYIGYHIWKAGSARDPPCSTSQQYLNITFSNSMYHQRLQIR